MARKKAPPETITFYGIRNFNKAAEDSTVLGKDSIYCPNAEMQVPLTKCAECSTREGCPSHAQ